MPDQALDPGWWSQMSAIFGPGGVVLLITNGASWYGLWLFWKRLNEKDKECQTERETARAYTRADVKEAFGIVGKLTEQVTLLAERAKTTATRTRED